MVLLEETIAPLPIAVALVKADVATSARLPIAVLLEPVLLVSKAC